jgi:cell division protein FtsA
MEKEIVTSIDVGTSTTKVIVAEIKEDGAISILGLGIAKTKGMKNGYVINKAKVSESISQAINEVVKATNIRPVNTYLGISGLGLASTISTGTSTVKQRDGHIDDMHIKNASDDAARNAEDMLINRHVIHIVPISNMIDNEKAICEPVGMQGTKLESTVILIHALEKHIKDLVDAVEENGIDVIDVMASPVAASYVTLSQSQRLQGCVFMDIGAQTTDVIIFDDDKPISLTSLPFGSDDITNAIAVEFKISTEDAERVKRDLHSEINYPKTVIDKVILKRTSKLFADVKRIIKNIDDDILLPSGVLITGGGSMISNIDTIAKDSLKLPAKIIFPRHNALKSKPELGVAYGICRFGIANKKSSSGFFSSIKKSTKKLSHWLKRFLP